MKTTTNRSQLALPVLKEVVDALEELGLLETIYGYADDKGCRIVAVANELPSEQRDRIWMSNLDFQQVHPDLYVDIRLIQRRGQALSEIFEDDGTAIIIREIATA